MGAAKKDFNDFIGRVRRAYRKLGHISQKPLARPLVFLTADDFPGNAVLRILHQFFPDRHDQISPNMSLISSSSDLILLLAAFSLESRFIPHSLPYFRCSSAAFFWRLSHIR